MKKIALLLALALLANLRVRAQTRKACLSKQTSRSARVTTYNFGAYPGKDKLDEFGFYHLNSSDLYFPGNRQRVKCAVFSDKKGNGFALVATDANVAVERTREGIVVSHNAYVSGRYNKFGWPGRLYSFEKLSDVSGSFTLVPLTENWPVALRIFFGSPAQVAIPFVPFYTSYDR